MSFWAPFDRARPPGRAGHHHCLVEAGQRAVEAAPADHGLRGGSCRVCRGQGLLAGRPVTAAMVLMFLSGCFKYAERILCLYLASPEKLRLRALGDLPDTLKKLQDTKDKRYLFGLFGSRNKSRAKKMREKLDNISEGSSGGLQLFDASIRDILTADAPLNSSRIVSFAEDNLPDMLKSMLNEKAHGEISTILSGQDQQGQQVTLDEKAAITKLFQAKKKEEQQDQSTIDIEKHEEPANYDNAADSFRQKLMQIAQGLDSPKRAAVTKLFEGKKKEEQQDQSRLDTKKREESADNDNADDRHHLQKLSQSAQDLYSPVAPRACEVAQLELISIRDNTERWDLIASVWSEMLFYTAPRCGAAFHYEHLSTGGEFITHALLLMKFLGPFLPPPGA
ncbi:hypothetical protein BAE44_0013782 [Dichanthelium oligosanthes]|uniref:Uncharacterized protein n=1 Tax=Dichanthelium oligosanthes TaxID=888268 RepID=A0A1E5VJB1_9POAL|nr:hypothetical protein BAE44_0013782 [Dichanthelium oligosanthes]